MENTLLWVSDGKQGSLPKLETPEIEKGCNLWQVQQRQLPIADRR